MNTQGQTNNVGQIAAIWISPSAPENQKLIWYDTLESVHKVYETSTGIWVAINPQVVTNSTIATLTTIAQGAGLSVGKFYYLTDVGTLAIAINTTKVWYVDSHGNYVVNDLAGSIQAYVNSTNLLIDGATGVWEDGKLKFKFTTYSYGSSLQTANDYIVMRRKNGSVWNWIKIKLQGLISSVSGNSITWNSGLFFNFNSSLNAKKNTAGGIVGWEKYNSDKSDLQSGINAATQSNQQILNTAKGYTDTKTSDDYIYNTLQHGNPYTLLNNPPEVPGTGANLHTALTILLSWVKILQNANKIVLGNSFNNQGRSGNVNYTDSVLSAVEKLVYKIKVQSKSDGVSLPSNFNPSGFERVLPSGNDNLTTAIGKIAKLISGLSSDFEEFYRDKFYSYSNGEWVSSVADDEYVQNIPNFVFRVKYGLLTIRLTNFSFTTANLKYNEDSYNFVIPLGFFPSGIANKFIKSGNFILTNNFTLINNYPNRSYAKYYYSILQVIKTFACKRSDNQVVNIEMAILYEYSKNEQSDTLPTGRVLIGMYALDLNRDLISMNMGNYTISVKIFNELYSLYINDLLQ